jgi:hypothetical protein
LRSDAIASERVLSMANLRGRDKLSYIVLGVEVLPEMKHAVEYAASVSLDRAVAKAQTVFLSVEKLAQGGANPPVQMMEPANGEVVVPAGQRFTGPFRIRFDLVGAAQTASFRVVAALRHKRTGDTDEEQSRPITVTR